MGPDPFSLDGPLVTVLISESLPPAKEGSVLGFIPCRSLDSGAAGVGLNPVGLFQLRVFYN